MAHKQRPVSVADIHDIYGGQRPNAKAEASPSYRKASFSVRETSHPGSPPPRLPPNVKTRSR